MRLFDRVLVPPNAPISTTRRPNRYQICPSEHTHTHIIGDRVSRAGAQTRRMKRRSKRERSESGSPTFSAQSNGRSRALDRQQRLFTAWLFADRDSLQRGASQERANPYQSFSSGGCRSRTPGSQRPLQSNVR
eukprot:1780883-Rhodomonas_salina.5